MYQYSLSAYQNADADGTCLGDLTITVYNSLARDYILAAEAVRQNQIQRRCDLSKHALLLLAHLESWANDIEELHLAASLTQFYRMLRERTVLLQSKPNAESFDEISRFVLQARGAWQMAKARAQLSLATNVAGYAAEANQRFRCDA